MAPSLPPNLTRYAPALRELLAREELNDLGPGRPVAALRPALARLSPAALDPRHPPRDLDFAHCCLSALWLLYDFLDESHTLSQDIHTSTGSFWHGIMHRREPDAWNSKYWFRQVGRHPVIDQLARTAPTLGYNYTDAAAFVDFCESVRGTNTPQEQTARAIQQLEWRLLFDYCYQAAWPAEPTE
ncbi:MAG: hypothetical protein U0939_01795 [Pirellulales bacterium]